MGLGFKDFVAGATLTSGEVDGYLMRQTNMAFSSTSERDTELAGSLEHGMFAVTTDTNSVWYYNGSAWVGWSTSWTSFTPTWSNLTAGSGVTHAWKYRYRSGDMLIYGGTTLGTGGAVTGSLSMTLPDSASTAGAGIRSIGTTWLIDANGADLVGSCSTSGASSSMFFYSNIVANVNATTPHTWTDGDVIAASILVAL